MHKTQCAISSGRWICPNTRVGIIAFSDKSTIVASLTNNEKGCIRAIRSITCGQTGGGNATHPFNTIMDMLQGKDGRLFAIVLADGVWSNQHIAVEAAHRCNVARIETAAIGFGGADKKFLKDISSEDANAMFVSQSELINAFGTIAQSLGGGTSKSGTDGIVSDAETWDD